jgi:ATP-dependent Clp protease protease subunit
MNRLLAKAHEIAAKHRQAVRPHALFAKTSETKGALYVYEVIGEDWWTGGGVTAKGVVAALDAMKGVKALDIYINSEGGDVFEAKAIYANLKRFDAEKTVHVDGIAASAATLIAMAGDKIVTAQAATWMIHEAWSIALGTAADMRSMAEVLDLQNQSLAETYVARNTKGKTLQEVLGLMAKETWMSAKDALDMGFTDEIAPDEKTTEEQPAATNTSKLIAAAARTQDLIRSAAGCSSRSTAELHAKRVDQFSPRASPVKQRSGLP